MGNEHVKVVMGPLWFPLHLFLLTQLHPSHSHQSLECFNDYINNITCDWDSKEVLLDTVCTLRGDLERMRKITRTCELKPRNTQNPARRGCRLVFGNRSFSPWIEIAIRVTCENMTDPVAQIQDYRPHLHIKMNPPGTPNVVNYSISWSSGRPSQDNLSGYVFELQYKQEEQHWKDVESVNTGEKMQAELNQQHLEKGKSYQVRVRVGPPLDYNGTWSHWSPVTSWRSKVGREPPRTGEVIRQQKWQFIGLGAALLFLLVAASFTSPIRHIWVCKENLKLVPNPSQYFDVLNSIHGGNFQKWLSPVFSAQSFDILQYSEDISPVEVSSAEDGIASFRKESATASEERDISGQSPGFSNLSYFYPSRPYKADTPPPVCSGGRPTDSAAEQGKTGAGVPNAGSIQMSSSYECLHELLDQQGEPTHPDSGIGVGSEDQDTEDDEGDDEAEDEEDGERKETALPSDPSALLPFGKSPFHGPFPQHLSAFSRFPFPLPSGGMGDLIEPCSDEYMSVKEIRNSSPA